MTLEHAGQIAPAHSHGPLVHPLADGLDRFRRSETKAHSAGIVDCRLVSSTGWSWNTSQPNRSTSARTIREDTAAIGSPIACPEWIRATPMVRIMVPTIQIQTC